MSNERSPVFSDGVQRKILHVDMDAFYVSVALLKHPELKGKPVIVGGQPPRGVVSTCSYEAREYGVHSGMSAAQAQRLCPKAVWLDGDFALYAHYSKQMIDILKRYSPEVVQLSIDEARVDLTGSERLLGPAVKIANRILLDIRRELRLPASAGLANSGTVAKIAAELAKPEGLAVILPGYEKPFLSPLKIERIPGIGPKSLPRFHRFGIRTIGDLTRLDTARLASLFGRWAVSLRQIALGESRRPFRHRSISSSRSHEETFPVDIFDIEIIRHETRRLVEKLGYRLRRQRLKARVISVKIRDGKFNTITRSVTLKRPVDSDPEIFRAAIDLIEKNLPGKTGIRLIGVKASQLVQASRQLELFRECRKTDVFLAAVDAIKDRFGKDVVAFGRTRRDYRRSFATEEAASIAQARESSL